MTSDPLKVVVLPDAGPENPFQYQLVRYFRQEGFDVVIGEKYTIGSTLRAIFAHHPTVIYYDWVHSFILGKSRLWTYFKSSVFVAEILAARYLFNIRFVHTLHNLQNHAGLWLRWERRIYGLFLRKCHQIRVYSEETRQAAMERFSLQPERVKVIQDLPYHFYYPNTLSKNECRKRLNLNDDDFVYLFFGEIKPYKGVSNLIDAFAEIARPNDRLLIAGKSYDATFFEPIEKAAQANSSIHLHHRFIQDDEVQIFFNAADVVVLPFIRIDHSGSIDLALSFRKPIVTLKTDATARMLAHQSTLLFETPSQLPHCLQIARELPLQAIGNQNFAIADSTNYRDLTLLVTL